MPIGRRHFALQLLVGSLASPALAALSRGRTGFEGRWAVSVFLSNGTSLFLHCKLSKGGNGRISQSQAGGQIAYRADEDRISISAELTPVQFVPSDSPPVPSTLILRGMRVEQFINGTAVLITEERTPSGESPFTELTGTFVAAPESENPST